MWAKLINWAGGGKLRFRGHQVAGFTKECQLPFLEGCHLQELSEWLDWDALKKICEKCALFGMGNLKRDPNSKVKMVKVTKKRI